MLLGTEGLAEVDLLIPQKTTFSFDIIHKDERGNVIDHSNSTIKMVAKMRGSSVDLSEHCEGTGNGISVVLPSSATARLTQRVPFPYDMMVTTESGEVFRMIYGNVNVVDTYSKDE